LAKIKNQDCGTLVIDFEKPKPDNRFLINLSRTILVCTWLSGPNNQFLEKTVFYQLLIAIIYITAHHRKAKPPNLATIAKQNIFKGKLLKQTCFKEKYITTIYTKITHEYQHTSIRIVENETDLQILNETREKRLERERGIDI
jgi:hypothetical protein